MSDRPADPAELDPDAPQGSVFGNLPDSRPGGRSPRRDSAAKPRKAAAKRTTRAEAKPKPAAKPKAARPASPPRTTMPPKPEAGEPESGTGLDDIAWAGVATIAEAATVGVRLLNKTLEALRGGSEKS